MAWLIIIVTSLLAACKTTGAKPALVIENTESTQEALTLAVSKAVGAMVTLAPDSFTEKPSVTIEPPSVNKRGGKIIDGRSLEMPTHIDLIMMGQRCYVVNRETSEKYLLEGVSCTALPKP